MEILDKKLNELTVREFIAVLKEGKKSNKEKKPYTFKIKERGVERYKTDEDLQKIINNLYEYDETAKMPSREVFIKVNEVYIVDQYKLGVQLNKMGYKSKLMRTGSITCKAYRLKLKHTNEHQQ